MIQAMWIDNSKLPYLQKEGLNYVITKTEGDSSRIVLQIADGQDLSRLVYAGVKYGMEKAFQTA